MELYSSYETCCACGACMNICPKQAIRMKENEEGFLYPVIDETLCVECEKCKKVCAFQNKEKKKSLKETYVAVSQNTNLKESASGGLFASFAKAVLEENGEVYGAVMDYDGEVLSVHHICTNNEQELMKLKGSKYVQSDLGSIHKDIEISLNDHKDVLFSGTPCQVAGLKSFLGKEYENLYTIDIICHGVPSIKLFRDYISCIEEKENRKVIDFKFRDKGCGWKLYGKMVLQDNQGNIEEKYFEPEESSYYQMFLNSYTYRENCYQCPYASENRQGDITIGDYWCIDLIHPELLTEYQGVLEEKEGVSCLIINNSQGSKIMKEFGYGIQVWESKYELAAKYNGQLLRAAERKKEREKVFNLYAKGYAYIEKWYDQRHRLCKIKRKIVSSIPPTIKKIMKQIILQH